MLFSWMKHETATKWERGTEKREREKRNLYELSNTPPVWEYKRTARDVTSHRDIKGNAKPIDLSTCLAKSALESNPLQFLFHGRAKCEIYLQKIRRNKNARTFLFTHQIKRYRRCAGIFIFFLQNRRRSYRSGENNIRKIRHDVHFKWNTLRASLQNRVNHNIETVL